MTTDSEALCAVAQWRGRCLNKFARAERAVGLTMEKVVETYSERKLRHLAGQRFADLEDVARSAGGTPRQLNALGNALQQWKEIEKRRQFLAHGVVAISHNDNGAWTVLFVIVVYRSNEPIADRWAVQEGEAAEFERELGAAFEILSSQLSQFRRRLVA